MSNQTVEMRAIALIRECGAMPLAIIAGRLGTEQQVVAVALLRARREGEIERFYLEERLKTRKGSWRPGTEMYQIVGR